MGAFTMKRLLLVSTAMFLVPAASFAQEAVQTAKGPAPAVEEIVVTGSRIAVGELNAPTPVSVVSAETLLREAPATIAESLRNLPVISSAFSPRQAYGTVQSVSAGDSGLSTVNLRGLGGNRTLVLINGLRIVNSSLGGGVDLSTIPQSLVERVEVVTGGASAAYGSDALAGVINFILKKNFVGVDAEVEGGGTFYGDAPFYKANLTYGTEFAGGKGRMQLNGGWFDTPTTVYSKERNYYKGQRLINNPLYTASNDQPLYIKAFNVNVSQATDGGLITGGPLKGIQFVGPEGSPVPFDFGQVSGQLGWGGTPNDTIGQHTPITAPQRALTSFGNIAYDLSDELTLDAQVMFGKAWSKGESVPYTRLATITVRNDNPYLDPTIRTQMAALNITTFPFGTTNWHTFGNVGSDNIRTLVRHVVGIHGDHSGWLWNASWQHSHVKSYVAPTNDPITARYALAVDAVRAPNGSIICRSTLTDPANGCNPIDIFGTNAPSEAAFAYVVGADALPWGQYDLGQHHLVFDVSTELFDLWAGPLAAAAGVEHRRSSAQTTADARSATFAYALGNYQPFSAKTHVTEGFFEANAPLLRDQAFAESLDLNGAVRLTNYQTSGLVTTWKVGATWDVGGGVRFRVTQSRDIREPSLDQLFNPSTSTFASVFDPFNNQTVDATLNTGQNPDLAPEKANTTAAGIVLQPEWLRGFTASFDYYRININGSIGSPSYPNVLNFCFQGVQIYCQGIRRDASGRLTRVDRYPVNQGGTRVRGMDATIAYSYPLDAGSLTFKATANYQPKQVVLDPLGNKNNIQGCVSANCLFGTGSSKFRGSLSTTYDVDAFSITAHVRYIGSAKLNNEWGPKMISAEDNEILPVAYLNLQGSYTQEADNYTVQYFVALENVTNTKPPAAYRGPTTSLPFFFPPFVSGVYDFLGPQFRAGVRFKM